jgi:hypothetical protein
MDAIFLCGSKITAPQAIKIYFWFFYPFYNIQLPYRFFYIDMGGRKQHHAAFVLGGRPFNFQLFHDADQGNYGSVVSV